VVGAALPLPGAEHEQQDLAEPDNAVDRERPGWLIDELERTDPNSCGSRWSAAPTQPASRQLFFGHVFNIGGGETPTLMAA